MSDAATQRFFAGFVLGVLQNDQLTDAERLERMADKAIDLELAEDLLTATRKHERSPWLEIAICGICSNPYSKCDCAKTGRR